MQSIAFLLAAAHLVQAGPVVEAPDQPAAPCCEAPAPEPLAPLPASFTPARDTLQGPRPRAFEYSDAYYTRLAIHHWASYATLPLFAAEAIIGQQLYSDTTFSSGGLREAHRLVALGVAGLFGVNTITGVWNLWEARKDPNDRLRRYLHAGLMLASDAGFVWTGMSGPGRRSRYDGTFGSRASQHRTIAIASMSAATVGYLMMLVWK